MKAIILAAGEGRRLRPYTADKPKCLVPVHGVPLLDLQLASLREAGCSDIVLVTGYCAEALADYPVRRWHNPRYAATNMVYSLFCAEPELHDPLLVAYADIVYSPQIVRRVMEGAAPVNVAVDLAWERLWRLRFDDPLADAETLQMDEAGHIIDIGRRPSSLAEIQAQYIGLISFQPPGLEALHAAWAAAAQPGTEPQSPLAVRGRERAYMTDMLRQLLRDGVPVTSVPIAGGWFEVDTVADLHAYECALAAGDPGPHFQFLRQCPSLRTLLKLEPERFRP